MDAKGMGKRLRAYRTQKGWTIQECAERAGLSTRYLADLERGDKIPRMETFVRLMNVLSASADDVLQDSLDAGVELKASALSHRLDALDPARKRQALAILEILVSPL